MGKIIMGVAIGLAILELASDAIVETAEEACLKAYRMGYEKGKWGF